MEEMAEESGAVEAEADVALERGVGRLRRLVAWFKRNVTPRLGTAIVLWRIEAYLATPLALVLVATLGRWPAALTMGLIMAAWSGVFFYLLDGERVLGDLRRWAYRRRWIGRYLRALTERRDGLGMTRRVALGPLMVLALGPFWRAVALHLLGAPRLPGYMLTVLGSIPHSLLWTGVVLGGLWEALIWPFLDSHWF